jgi:hypothetical protein
MEDGLVEQQILKGKGTRRGTCRHVGLVSSKTGIQLPIFLHFNCSPRWVTLICSISWQDNRRYRGNPDVMGKGSRWKANCCGEVQDFWTIDIKSNALNQF